MNAILINVIILLFGILVLLPSFLSFIVLPLVLAIAGRVAVPRWYKQMNGDKTDRENREQRKFLIRLARTPLRKRYISLARDGQKLWNDIREYLQIDDKRVQNISLRDLSECLYLLFCDLEGEYRKRPLMRKLLKMSLSSWKKGLTLSERYKSFSRLPLISQLLRTRLLFRIISIPLLLTGGLPIILISLIQQFIITSIMEGLVRYYYSLLLIKLAYYAFFLLGKPNEEIRRKLALFSKEPVRKERFAQNELITAFLMKTDPDHPLVTYYLSRLEEWDIPPDTLFADKKNWKILLETTSRAFSSYLNPPGNKNWNQRIRQLTMELASRRFPSRENPFLALSPETCLCGTYLATVYTLDRILGLPGTHQLMKGINLGLTKQGWDLLNGDLFKTLKNWAPLAVTPYRMYQQTRRFSRLIKLNPMSLVSLSGHIAWVHLWEKNKTEIIQQYSRLWLFLLMNKDLSFSSFKPSEVFLKEKSDAGKSVVTKESE